MPPFPLDLTTLGLIAALVVTVVIALGMGRRNRSLKEAHKTRDRNDLERLKNIAYDELRAQWETEQREPSKKRTIRDLSPGKKKITNALLIVILLGSMTIIGAGLYGSFYTVKQAAIPAFGEDAAWVAPVFLDGAMVVLIFMDVVFGFWGKATRGIRYLSLIPMAIVLWINGNAEGGTALHIGAPIAVIIFSDIGRRAILSWVDVTTESPQQAYETFPIMLWILRPLPTFLMWRRRVIHPSPLNTLEEVANLNARYVLAVSEARKKWGWRWRWQAPYDVRWAIKYDELGEGDVKKIGALVAKELFGGVLADARARNEIAAPTQPKATTPKIQPPALIELPAPPAPEPETVLAQVPAQRAGHTGDDEADQIPSDFRLKPNQKEVYLKHYEPRRLAGEEEMEGPALAELLGINAGHARNLRNKKFRPLFQLRNGGPLQGDEDAEGVVTEATEFDLLVDPEQELPDVVLGDLEDLEREPVTILDPPSDEKGVRESDPVHAGV